jgi:hypothetical protein
MIQFLSVLLHCLQIAKETAQKDHSHDVTQYKSVAFQHAKEELLQTGCFFPHYPIRKEVKDGGFKGSIKESDNCIKSYKSSGRLGAGVLLFWCLEHRECIGFTVLRSAESCKDVYEIMSTRANMLPEILVYDNACNLFEVL